MSIGNPKDIQIPVPYGYIAAKEWGSSNGRPVLAIHGWMNNCATFDTLIPMLPPDLHVVAIDEPGVGLSSRLPIGSIIHYEDLLYDILRILNYFQWDRIIMMGHSRGAVVSLLFAGLFPEKVEKIISLDIFKIIAPTPEVLAARAGTHMRNYLEMEKKSQQRELPMAPKDALDVLMFSHNESLTEESARILMKRGTRKDKEKVIFTRDLRLNGFNILDIEENVLLAILERMQCEILVIRATKQGSAPLTEKEKEKWLDIYARCSTKFVYEEIDGSHHVHLNQPELIAPIINNFLQ